MRLRQADQHQELRAIAKRRLPRFVFDYVDGGAEDEITLRAQLRGIPRLLFRPRTLVDVSRRDLTTRLLGAPSALPVVVGPTALNGLSWPDGDMELARAATAAGVPFAMSTVSMSLLEDVAREAPGRLWLQAYVFSERRITDAIIARAHDGRIRVRGADERFSGRRQARARPAHRPAAAPEIHARDAGSTS